LHQSTGSYAISKSNGAGNRKCGVASREINHEKCNNPLAAIVVTGMQHHSAVAAMSIALYVQPDNHSIFVTAQKMINSRNQAGGRAVMAMEKGKG